MVYVHNVHAPGGNNQLVYLECVFAKTVDSQITVITRRDVYSRFYRQSGVFFFCVCSLSENHTRQVRKYWYLLNIASMVSCFMPDAV